MRCRSSCQRRGGHSAGAGSFWASDPALHTAPNGAVKQRYAFPYRCSAGTINHLLRYLQCLQHLGTGPGRPSGGWRRQLGRVRRHCRWRRGGRNHHPRAVWGGLQRHNWGGGGTQAVPGAGGGGANSAGSAGTGRGSLAALFHQRIATRPSPVPSTTSTAAWAQAAPRAARARARITARTPLRQRRGQGARGMQARRWRRLQRLRHPRPALRHHPAPPRGP